MVPTSKGIVVECDHSHEVLRSTDAWNVTSSTTQSASLEEFGLKWAHQQYLREVMPDGIVSDIGKP